MDALLTSYEHKSNLTSACFCLATTLVQRRITELRKSPESCQSKVLRLCTVHRFTAPCQSCCCCCCPPWDALLGAVGRALILSSLVNSRFDAHLRCLVQCVLHDVASLCHVIFLSPIGLHDFEKIMNCDNLYWYREEDNFCIIFLIFIKTDFKMNIVWLLLGSLPYKDVYVCRKWCVDQDNSAAPRSFN